MDNKRIYNTGKVLSIIVTIVIICSILWVVAKPFVVDTRCLEGVYYTSTDERGISKLQSKLSIYDGIFVHEYKDGYLSYGTYEIIDTHICILKDISNNHFKDRIFTLGDEYAYMYVPVVEEIIKFVGTNGEYPPLSLPILD